jgi:two-component system phosphate regulon sensor histidine kinase PhoR
MTTPGRAWRLIGLSGLLLLLVCGLILAALPSAADADAVVSARLTLVRRLGLASVLAAAGTLFAAAVFHLVQRRAVLELARRVRAVSQRWGTEAPAHAGDAFIHLSAAVEALGHGFAAQLERLERQRHLLAALLDGLQEGVVVARDDGRIALINPAALRLLGLESRARQSALLGQPLEAVIADHTLQQLLHPPAGAAEPSGAQRVDIETGGATTYLLARASTVVWIDPDVRGAGPVRSRAVVLSDVSELQRLLAIRTDFAANASHELRTPLATIRAAVEAALSLDLAVDADAARGFLDKLDRHTQRLERLVEDLLDLSRIEGRAARFTPEPLDAARLASDLDASFAERVAARRLQWSAACTPPTATLYANAYLLNLALGNLLDNAVKFTEPGGWVALDIAVRPDAATIVVSDTGCGIPPEEQERVFERFYQVERARSGAERGTGLGLSIVRHAVAALGGTVRMESEVGRGTRVTVVIPQAGA